jgi:hypothetical protein
MDNLDDIKVKIEHIISKTDIRLVDVNDKMLKDRTVFTLELGDYDYGLDIHNEVFDDTSYLFMCVQAGCEELVLTRLNGQLIED